MGEGRFNGLERRRFIRMYIPLQLKFRIIDEEDTKESSKIYNATIKDISINALCMELSGLHKEAWNRIRSGQDKLELEINLPDESGLVKVSGESLRLAEDGGLLYYVGVIFTRIPEEDKTKLLQFIKSKLKEKEK